MGTSKNCIWLGVCVVGLALPLVFGGTSFWPSALSQFRNPLLLLLGVSFVGFLSPVLRESWRRAWSQPTDVLGEAGAGERRWIIAIFVFFLVAFVKVSLLNFWSLRVNAYDFSMIYYLAPNTAIGRFMQAPTCFYCNHFSIHSTPILFLWYPLQLLSHSPYVLILLHPLLIWASGLALYFLLRILVPIPLWRILILLGYFLFFPVNRVVMGDFHIESFYPVVGFLFFLGLLERRLWLALVSALLFLSIKEDAAVYLGAVGAGLIVGSSQVLRALPNRLSRRWSNRTLQIFGGTLLLVSLGIFWINTHVVIPMNSPTGVHRPLEYVSKYGSSVNDMVMGMLSHPWSVLHDVVTGEWVKIAVGFLFVPFLYWMIALPLTAFSVIHSASSISTMRGLITYYSAPSIAFFMMGFLLFLSARLQGDVSTGARGVPPPSLPRDRGFLIGRGVLAVWLIFSFFVGNSYLKFEPSSINRDDVARLVGSVPEDASVCAQTSLMPQFPFREKMFVLNESCLERRPDFMVAHPQSSAYPLDSAGLAELLEKIRQTGAYDEVPVGDFLLFKRK